MIEMPPPTVTLDHYPSPSVDNDGSGGSGHHICTTSSVHQKPSWVASVLTHSCAYTPPTTLPATSMLLNRNFSSGYQRRQQAFLVLAHVLLGTYIINLCARDMMTTATMTTVPSGVNKLAIVILLLGAQNQVIK